MTACLTKCLLVRLVQFRSSMAVSDDFILCPPTTNYKTVCKVCWNFQNNCAMSKWHNSIHGEHGVQMPPSVFHYVNYHFNE
uniref:Putative secreted peptide n=1 Tax=Anopheles braziliensis TaxID=58242 RepID=A0A2M3ZWV1_9DIPT